VTPPRRLVLLRHAKAEHAERLTDHERPLALLGRRQSTHVGTALAAAGVAPDLVLCSSALRTRQTWELVRPGLGTAPRVEVTEDLYVAGVRDLLDVVRAVGDDVATVLVVGHEPTMSQAAAVLAGPGSDEPTLERVRVGVPTAAWSLLSTQVAWSALEPDGATLESLTVPAL